MSEIGKPFAGLSEHHQASSVSKLGGTLGLGVVRYQGGVDELNAKCRQRDDEIDLLRSLLDDLMKAVEPFAYWSELIDAQGLAGDSARLTTTSDLRRGELRKLHEAYLKAKGE